MVSLTGSFPQRHVHKVLVIVKQFCFLYFVQNWPEAVDSTIIKCHKKKLRIKKQTNRTLVCYKLITLWPHSHYIFKILLLFSCVFCHADTCLKKICTHTNSKNEMIAKGAQLFNPTASLYQDGDCIDVSIPRNNLIKVNNSNRGCGGEGCNWLASVLPVTRRRSRHSNLHQEEQGHTGG